MSDPKQTVGQYRVGSEFNPSGDDAVTRLKAKAAAEGSSLSDFVLAELEMIAKRPTPREFRRRLRKREPVHLSPTAAEVIRELRQRD